jgi:hypothetical protein
MNCLYLLPLLSALPLAADEGPVEKGLVVHEWGVFRVHGDADIANADARDEWAELPKFMYGHVAGRDLPTNWGIVEPRKQPIIFFHAPKPLQVYLHIDFPGGMPGVWWPGTRTPAHQADVKAAVGTKLEWLLHLKEAPPGRRARRDAFREVPKGHWVEASRAVKCDDVYAIFGEGTNEVDREKFVYYDGIFPQGKWLKITVDKERVALVNQVKFPVYDVTVVDRRGDGKVRLARLEKLDAGAEVKAVEWKEVERDRFAAEAGEALVKQLVAAGLYKDEAEVLLTARRRDFFETDGVGVFYRIPQAEYEKRLPLTLTPRAESLVRVGLVHHDHCEPDFAERVKELVKQLDDDSFKVREAAQKKLEAMGPSVRVHLARLRDKGDLSVEVKRRVETLIDRWDARKALPR